MITKDEITMYI